MYRKVFFALCVGAAMAYGRAAANEERTPKWDEWSGWGEVTWRQDPWVRQVFKTVPVLETFFGPEYPAITVFA